MNNASWIKEANDINDALKKIQSEITIKNSGINVTETEKALDTISTQINVLETKGADVDTIEDLNSLVKMVHDKLKTYSVFGGRLKRSRSKRRSSKRRSSKRRQLRGRSRRS